MLKIRFSFIFYCPLKTDTKQLLSFYEIHRKRLCSPGIVEFMVYGLSIFYLYCSWFVFIWTNIPSFLFHSFLFAAEHLSDSVGALKCANFNFKPNLLKQKSGDTFTKWLRTNCPAQTLASEKSQTHKTNNIFKN